jgi:hypothetical protein
MFAPRPRGTALIVSMALVMVLAGLAAVLLNEMRTRAQRSEVDGEDVKAFEAAEAGMDAALRNLNTGGNGCTGLGWSDVKVRPVYMSSGWVLGRWTDLDNDGDMEISEVTAIDAGDVSAGGWRPAMDGVPFSAPGYERPVGQAEVNTFRERGAASAAPYPRPEPTEFNFYEHSVVFGDVRYFTYAIAWSLDNLDNDGNGVVDDAAEQDWYTVWSTGFSNPATPQGRFVTVEAVVQRLSWQDTLKVDAALEVQVDEFKP